MNDHKLVIKADARAMGAVTALDTRVSDRWAPSVASKRTFGNKPFTGTSECISYTLDENGNRVDARIFRTTRANKPNRRRNSVIVAQENDISLMATMGSIHVGAND